MIKSIDDIFGEPRAIDLSKSTCHSGGAKGSDSIFESESITYGAKVKAYSYKTKNHTSINKVEISETDFKEGVDMIRKANKTLNRYGIHKYMNLLARNWSQVKYSDQIFAIGKITSPNKKGAKYYNKSKYEVVDGGTGYAVQMCIDNNKEVFIFNINDDNWYIWSSSTFKFIKCSKDPYITKMNFGGIGTRNITESGIEAIKNLFELTNRK